MTRIQATGNMNFYIAPPTSFTGGYWASGGTVTVGGDDVLGDGSQAHPWATLQHAIDTLYANYDWVGKYAPTINVASKPAPGQFYYPRAAMSGRLLGQPGTMAPLQAAPGKPTFAIGNYNPFTIQGDPANPLGAFIVSGDFGFPADGPAFSMTEGAAAKVLGLTFDSGQSFQDNLDVMIGSFLDLSNVYFGNAGTPPNSYNINIGLAFNSTLFITGPINIVGNASAFIQAGQSSTIITNNNTGETGKVTITFSGPTFTTAAFVIDGSHFYIQGLQFAGSFTGNGILAVDNASISNGTGAGPNTCPVGLVLGHPSVIQDNSVCR